MSISLLQTGLLILAVGIVLASCAAAYLAYASRRDTSQSTDGARREAIHRERVGAENIPYLAHVHELVVKTAAGDYVQVLRLQGASFESADDSTLNTWHERLNVLWRNIASDHVAIWTHIVRRREQVYPPGECPPGFSRELDLQYKARVRDEILMTNELYVSVVYRAQPGVVSGTALKWLTKTSDANTKHELHDALEHCAKLRTQLLSSLDRYEPEVLGIYKQHGRYFSSLLEFVSLLLNGESQPVPLPRAPLNDVLLTTRPLFGREAMEYRSANRTMIGAFLGIKEYPTPTEVGMFNRLLQADYPFILTQSFTFLQKSTAQWYLSSQYARMRNAADLAVSQAEELQTALDELTSNKFVMGDHHFSLLVLAEPFEGSKEAETPSRMKQLLDNVEHARSVLADTGMVVAREDLVLEAAYWAQLPGNFAFRPRKAPITSRNFAAMCPFHNFPLGRPTGNHWGNALTMFITRAMSPYYFSLHASDPRDPEGGSRKDIGHSGLIGPSGSGKTVVIGFLICMVRKTQATQIVFDKDRGLEILVRAEGGCYLALKDGLPTGMNPLQLDPSSANLEFLKAWLRSMVARKDHPLTVTQERDLDLSLQGVMRLPREARGLSRLIEYLDATDPEGVRARLAKWCSSENGDYAWVFDNPDDHIVPLLHQSSLVGFDVTDFLNNETTRGPVTQYLFHLVRSMIDGRRIVVWMDEFSTLLSHPSFKAFAKDGLKTWRKLEAVAVFATQSPSDILHSEIARTLIEQTPTKIFFPNVDADQSEYCEGFGLTEQEFLLLKEHLDPGSRMFLVKQGHQSVVCQLDLQGFHYELNVISGRKPNLDVMHHIIADVGSDPATWLPLFRNATVQGSLVPARAYQQPDSSIITV